MHDAGLSNHAIALHLGYHHSTISRRGPNKLDVLTLGARSSSVVRAFAMGAMGRRIDPSIELFLVPASAP